MITSAVAEVTLDAAPEEEISVTNSNGGYTITRAPKTTKTPKAEATTTTTKAKENTTTQSGPSATQTAEGTNGGDNGIPIYASAGGAAAIGAAAAGVFFFRKRAQAGTAEVTADFSANNNMNPLYEGNGSIENPLYNGQDMDDWVEEA